MLSSGSFDAEDDVDVRPHTQLDDEHNINTTPSTPGLSGSQLSTPIMSQASKLALILNTPPANTEDSGKEGTHGASVHPPTTAANNDSNATTTTSSFMPSFPSNGSPQYTPSMFSSEPMGPSSLEPPAWKPPDKEEIEYADALNNAYNNQHNHYLQPFSTQDDSSTIGSSQTNNSFTNTINFNTTKALRPRGLSLCSYRDDHSVGSCPQPPQQGHGQHRRHPSLPVSFFSSSGQQHGSSQQLLFPTQEIDQHPPQQQTSSCKQYLTAIQSSTKSTPYELHSHHSVSQVRADGAMAGLDGILLDLYMVDRSIDSSAAKMLMLTSSEKMNTAGNNSITDEKEGRGKKKKKQSSSSQRTSRKTSLGTLNDIQCILELHKVDVVVDRFKHGLQMPEFLEEEAWISDVFRDLRRTDVEMEEYAKKRKEVNAKEERRKDVQRSSSSDVIGCQRRQSKELQYQFDLSDDNWKKDQKLGGEDIYISTESFLTDHDAYQFIDPHETEVLRANNSYQTSHVSASINDNLHEVIDLLRTDAEVDGASRHHADMKLIQPLLETDQLMNKWKERSDVRGMWDANLRALYMVDLEVDRATKMKCNPKPAKVKAEKKPAHMEECKAENGNTKQQDPLHPVDPAEHHQEVKDMLSQHIPPVPQQFCPTSPEVMPLKPISQASSFNLPPPAPMSSPQGRRAIFTSQEKSSGADYNTGMMPKPTTAIPGAKRSIFSRQEKTSAASHCAYQQGVMMPGTTTVVMAKGGEMIDDIPVGKVVMR